jgi:hypothetical protein
MTVFDFVLLTLALFWAWVSLRFALEGLLPSQVYDLSRFVHPLIVFAIAWVCYPHVIPAAAASGATGLLVAVCDRFFGTGAATATPVTIPRRRRGGLPPLP